MTVLFQLPTQEIQNDEGQNSNIYPPIKTCSCPSKFTVRSIVGFFSFFLNNRKEWKKKVKYFGGDLD